MPHDLSIDLSGMTSSTPTHNPVRVTGMRGDFLGQAAISWQDLEIGRVLQLMLVQRTGVRGGTVKGTIHLLVGEPGAEVRRRTAVRGGWPTLCEW